MQDKIFYMMVLVNGPILFPLSELTRVLSLRQRKPNSRSESTSVRQANKQEARRLHITCVFQGTGINNGRRQLSD